MMYLLHGFEAKEVSLLMHCIDHLITTDIVRAHYSDVLQRCDAAGILYEEATGEVTMEGDRAWIIEVPDDDPDAAFAWKMFVAP